MLGTPLYNTLQCYYLLIQSGSLSGRLLELKHLEKGKKIQVRQMDPTSRASANRPPACLPGFYNEKKPHSNFKQLWNN